MCVLLREATMLQCLYSAASTGMLMFLCFVYDVGVRFWSRRWVCYRVRCDPVLSKLLVKLSVCWPCRARREWSKQFRSVRGRGWGHGLAAYPSLISLLSDVYLINTSPSEKISNTFSVQNEPAEVSWSPLHITETKWTVLIYELGFKCICWINWYDSIHTL